MKDKYPEKIPPSLREFATGSLELVDGKLCFAAGHVPVVDVVHAVASGRSFKDISKTYSQLSSQQVEDIRKWMGHLGRREIESSKWKAVLSEEGPKILRVVIRTTCHFLLAGLAVIGIQSLEWLLRAPYGTGLSNRLFLGVMPFRYFFDIMDTGVLGTIAIYGTLDVARAYTGKDK